MRYTCRDCSYSGKKSGPDGACAACGSFNVSASRAVDSPEKTPSPLWHRIALVLSWSLLLIVIAQKLLE